MKKYYTVWYKLDQEEGYFIWYSNDVDRVIVNKSGHIPIFRDTSMLQAYVVQHHLSLENEEPTLYDLDFIIRWIAEPNQSLLNESALLNAWNLFGDIAVSVDDEKYNQYNQHDENADKVYEKLFWGNNLPSVTPSGEQYTPVWTQNEIAVLQEVLGYGISMFRNYIAVQIV